MFSSMGDIPSFSRIFLLLAELEGVLEGYKHAQVTK
jgi:hypothetical protein